MGQQVVRRLFAPLCLRLLTNNLSVSTTRGGARENTLLRIPNKCGGMCGNISSDTFSAIINFCQILDMRFVKTLIGLKFCILKCVNHDYFCFLLNSLYDALPSISVLWVLFCCFLTEIVKFQQTRSYAALRAADLDWIVGPGYSLGRVHSGEKP